MLRFQKRLPICPSPAKERQKNQKDKADLFWFCPSLAFLLSARVLLSLTLTNMPLNLSIIFENTDSVLVISDMHTLPLIYFFAYLIDDEHYELSYQKVVFVLEFSTDWSTIRVNHHGIVSCQPSISRCIFCNNLQVVRDYIS